MNALVPTPTVTFPPNPKVGQVFYNWVWNGSVWVCQSAGPVNIIKAFSVSGTYWPSPGLTFAVVECVGGGGGGGDVYAVTGYSGGGGGGGSGSYSRSSIAAALVVNGVQVTIGAGGGPQAPGGDTAFGTFCLAHGGTPGIGFGAGAINPNGIPEWGQGGWGGAAGTGDLAVYGNAGFPGANYYFGQTPQNVAVIYAGMGGESFFGGRAGPPGGGPGAVIAGQPIPALSPGAGGNGNVANQANLGTAQPGANGASGICIVTEWCFGNTSLVQPCGPCQPPCPPGGYWTPSW